MEICEIRSSYSKLLGKEYGKLNHILIIPNDLIDKLSTAQADENCHEKWLEIGVDTADDMMNAIINKMNEKFDKISITSYRSEDKNAIKDAVNNSGNVSKYLGYLENENGNIDGLFFYNEPQTSTGNDLMTRNIWPALMGIYNNILDSMVDLHISSRPVYIVNINETSRMSNRGVKINIICAMLSDFNYIDMFENSVLDIVSAELIPVDYMLDDGPVIELQGSPKSFFKSLEDFESLITENDYFEYDNENKIMSVLPNRFQSSNPSAELYRYCSKIVPAAYIAKENNFTINVEPLNDVTGSNLDILKAYLRKFNEQ